MKSLRVFLGVPAVLVIFSMTAAAGEPQDLLGQARKQVEEKRYGEALELYASMAPQLESDPGLTIEWARVYTYADRHPEAIRLFEKIRNEHPDREKEIVRELADQYKWNGQLESAIAAYRKGLLGDPGSLSLELGLAEALAWDGQHQEALKTYDLALSKDPGSVPAMLGKAEVLSWKDQLERAEDLYEKVLEKEPENLSALNGRARTKVWQGYHRSGIRQYQEILKGYPDSEDALEGLAYAYHWDGQEAKSLEALRTILAAHPERHAAKDLFSEIGGLRKPHLSQGNRFSHDSNKLEIFSERVHGGSYLGDSSQIGATYIFDRYRQDLNLPTQGHKAGLDISHRFNEYFEASSYLYWAGYNAERFRPFTTNTWLTLKPNNVLRIDAAYDRETFEDITALQRGILADSGSVSLDIRPNRRWFFSGKYKGSRYNDQNNQDTVFSKAEYRIWNKPYIKLYYNYYYSDFANQANNGYFNPFSIHAHTWGIYGSKDLTRKISIELQASNGYEWQDPKSDHPTYFAAATVNYRVAPQVVLFGRGEYFNAADTNKDKEYLKRSIWFGLTYSFGPEPERPYSAQQSQRPVVR